MEQVWLKVSAGGGITSQFTILLQNLLFSSIPLPSNNLYIDKGDNLKRLYVNYLKEDEQVFFDLPNWWDAVFDQTKSSTTTSFIELTNVYRIPYNFFTDPIDIENLPKYRDIVKKYLKFHPVLLSKVEEQISILGLDSNTLAVHLRLTDLNDAHSELGIITIEDYITHIKNVLQLHPNINKIFVASESLQSIISLQNHLPIPVVYVKDLRRAINDSHEFYKDQVMYMKDPLYWQEVFLDVFLLAECKYLLGRISNVTNTSIILNNKIQNYYCLNTILGYV